MEKKWINFSVKAVWWKQAVKLVVGLIGVLAIKSGLKMVLGESLAADALRYFLLIVWILAGWPALFARKK